MQYRWSIKRRSTWALIAAPVLAMTSVSIAAAASVAAHDNSRVSVGSRLVTYKAHSLSELDCNGWSKKYPSVDPGLRRICVDPRSMTRSGWSGGYHTDGRFMDNGHYVGHDEPSVKFISSAANSGNTMTYFMRLPANPFKRATNNGKIVDYAELSPAPWFGLPVCDPKSYPQNPCLPDSDINTGSGLITDAGSAFMELQFYPPGFAPWLDDVSCSKTFWCAALNIDSLEAAFHAQPNSNCPEPLNFAFLQTNGHPAGPPNPQRANGHTFTPNAHTLQMHAGDVLKVAISDPIAGLTTTVTDLTTHKTGFMVASAANGFGNTNAVDCSGSPFTFHAEYGTAAQQNQTPWTGLQSGVLMEQEIGHSEVCHSLANKDAINAPGVIVDKSVRATCIGGSEGGLHVTGEGPCSFRTGVCHHAETQGLKGPVGCPSNNFASGKLCEYSDGLCLPQGTRSVTLVGHLVKETSPVNFCIENQTQNGDLDFDGLSYQKTTWPNGSSNVPKSFRYVGPFDASGAAYPQIQFETNVGGSERLCHPVTGVNCTAPPKGSHFYPFWTITNHGTQQVGTGLFPHNSCVWNFGNVITGVTTQNFGRDKEYGAPDTSVFGGTLISRLLVNPEVSGSCPLLTKPH